MDLQTTHMLCDLPHVAASRISLGRPKQCIVIIHAVCSTGDESVKYNNVCKGDKGCVVYNGHQHLFIGCDNVQASTLVVIVLDMCLLYLT